MICTGTYCYVWILEFFLWKIAPGLDWGMSLCCCQRCVTVSSVNYGFKSLLPYCALHELNSVCFIEVLCFLCLSINLILLVHADRAIVVTLSWRGAAAWPSEVSSLGSHPLFLLLRTLSGPCFLSNHSHASSFHFYFLFSLSSTMSW